MGAAGAFVGSFFGPIGTSIGWSLGAALGNALFPQKKEQPLHDLHIQGSSYGAFQKIIYGTVRISGNVIWETDLQEHDGGGKGKTPEQQTFTASFDVGLCETAVVKVLRFWAAGRLNYDVNQPDGPTIPFVLYDGSSSQLPDPTEEATEGVGNVPAYRGKSRVVFTDWDMTQFGNSIPQLSFECATKGYSDDLHIVQANYATGQTISYAVPQYWGTDKIVIAGTNQSDSRTTATGTAYDLDPETYDLVSSHVVPPLLSYPCFWSGPTPVYLGIGNYVYANGSSTPLWRADPPSPYLTTSGDSSLCIVTNSVTAVFNGSVYITHDPAMFLNIAGVPDGVYVNTTALSEDGTVLFVTTGPTSSGASDTWYKITDGLVSDTGTISPTQTIAAMGGNPRPGSAGVMSVAVLENDYLWYYAGPSETLSLFKIVDGNLQDWGGGTLSIPFSANSSAGSEAGMMVVSDGVIGIAKGHAIVTVSRLGTADLTYLDEIVADLCDRAGLSSGQYDVSQLAGIVVDGYVIESQITCRQAIETLMPVYFFDSVESDGIVKFVLRGGDSVVTFVEGELAAHMDSEDLPSLLSCIHTQDVDLPSQLTITYLNKDADYQVNSQSSQRMVGGSRSVQNIQVPIVLSDTKAKQIVDAWMFQAYVERDAYTWKSSRKYAKYEPTDVVTVQGKVLRITKKTEGATGVITWEGVPSRSVTYVQAGAGGAAFSPNQTIPVSQSTNLVLLDVPMLSDSDDPEGFRAAAAGSVSNTWSAASLFQSLDGGLNYSNIKTLTGATVMGTVTALPDEIFEGGNIFDENSIFRLTVGVGGGTLSSTNSDAVLAGGNALLIGPEIVYFKNADLVSAGVYDVSGMLRGRRGTEWAIDQHSVGEFWALLSTTTDVEDTFADLGQPLHYKAPTLGQSLGSATDVPFTNGGAALRPYSPIELGGGCNAAGDVALRWTRRTRIGWQFLPVGEVPLGEESEAYVVQIWDSTYTNCARVITGVTSPTYTYTSAMQVTDFGDQQQTIYFSVGQVGKYELGKQAFGTCAGLGSSDDAVISPTTPYNQAPLPPPTGGSYCTLPETDSTIDWAFAARVVNNDFQPGQVWVVSFTTGSIVAGRGRVSGAEWGGIVAQRHMTLSDSPCGPPMSSHSSINSSSPSISFYMTGNPNPSQVATLAPDTTYYVSITTDATSAMFLDMTPCL